MLATISKEDQRKLKKAVLREFSNSPKAAAVLEYLFDLAISLAGPVPYVSESQLIEECPNGPRTEGAVRSLMSRIRDDLAYFFEEEAEGRKQHWKITIQLGDYAPTFEPNQPSPKSNSKGALTSFWTYYLMSSSPIVIYYTEPQFFRDEFGTYFHNANISSPHAKDFISELHLPMRDTRPNTGFVPSGIVQALVQLFEYFHQSGAPVTACPLHPAMDLPESDHDIIVLATNGTGRSVLARLEASLPHNLLPDNSSPNDLLKGRRSRKTKPTNLQSESTINYAVLTRRPHRVKGRSITVLSAQNGRAVEALAWLVTKDIDLRDVSAKFGEYGVFPDYFQIRITVPLLNSEAEPYIDPILVEDAIRLDPMLRPIVNSDRI